VKHFEGVVVGNQEVGVVCQIEC